MPQVWYRQAKATKRGGTGIGASEHLIVPAKQGKPLRGDPVEGRGCRITDPFEGNMASAQKLGTVSTKRERIAALAREHPRRAFTSLAHHMDMAWMREAYAQTRRDGAVGVDGQTAQRYAENLDQNLRTLLDRAKSGTYQAPPVRRVYIPKGRGDQLRPIGIPTFEDKVLQRAVVMVLESVYEQDFLPCSYGFRPGRSAHQALSSLREQVMAMQGCWVVELDIERFFDTLDHGHLREFLRRRIRDGVLCRLIDKWLKAGVMESGRWQRATAGTPQGGVISPLLANVYLHHVLDEWFERAVRPRLRGRGLLVRFADDAVLCLARQRDAQRVMDVLAKRFGRYGLRLHPVKTRQVAFRRPPRDASARRASKEPGVFDFLGFRHHWCRSRRGYWVVKRKTTPSRLSRALRSIRQWCRTHRHMPVAWQHQALRRKIRGHYAYYGITGNSGSLNSFYWAVRRMWRDWLSRRSRAGFIPWARYVRLLERLPLPVPVILHRV